MTINSFSQLENNNIKNNDYLVILLHGYGSNSEDIIQIAKKIYQPIINRCVCIAPNAPTKCKSFLAEENSLQWFDLYTNKDQIYNTMKQAIIDLSDFVDSQLEKLKIKPENLMVFGFSQGAMLALHFALQRKIPCANVICFSGMLIFPDELKNKIQSRSNFCLLHGMDDEIISVKEIDNTVLYLKENDIHCEYHKIPNLGHHVDTYSLEIMSNYIKQFFVNN